MLTFYFNVLNFNLQLRIPDNPEYICNYPLLGGGKKEGDGMTHYINTFGGTKGPIPLFIVPLQSSKF